MKILHLPTDVGGNSFGLSRAEQLLGFDSNALIKSSGWMDYPYEHCLDLDQIKNPLLKLAKLSYKFLKIRSAYDIFHFNCGSSLIHTPERGLCQFDIPFYPKKARLFVTYNGCDARQKYPTMQRTSIAACHEEECYQGVCNSGVRDRIRRKSIEKMAKYAHHIWALNPDLLYFLPPEKSSFLPYSIANYSKRRCYTPPVYPLKIIHAPTNRSAKGSKYILSALDEANKRFPGKVDIKLIENIPYKQAMKMYQEADLVIDQVMIGWYGAFAVEVMSMGKPVICRIAKEDLKFIPDAMRNDLLDSVINADPFDIKEVLFRSILDLDYLRERAHCCYDYAHRWHNPEYIAGLTTSMYRSVK